MEGAAKFFTVIIGVILTVWGLINIPGAVQTQAMGSFVIYAFLFFLGIWILGKAFKE